RPLIACTDRLAFRSGTTISKQPLHLEQERWRYLATGLLNHVGHRLEAERCLQELSERLGKFGLELHPEKTRLIEFGRFAAEHRLKAGLGKPEAFSFLGFTHYCGETRKGAFTIKRQSMAKRMRAKLLEIKAQLKRYRHNTVAEMGAWLRS